MVKVSKLFKKFWMDNRMNIIGHITIGIVGSVIISNPLFLLGSLLPDLPLIANEISLIRKKNKFNKFDVKYKKLYEFTHSLFPLLFMVFSPTLFISYLIHILVDIPFHTSSFRWKPFMINRWKSKKRALLLSGGADSVACFFIENNNDIDLIYFNYGQVYHNEEYPHALKLAQSFNKSLIVIEKNWGQDPINRNYLFVIELKKLGYDEVILGTRNIFPFFDKYKDSNWLNLKILQYIFNIYINMPLIGQFKWQIKNKIGKKATFFSTENYENSI